MNDNDKAETVLRALAEAIVRYKCRGEKDFQPVNEALLRADALLCPPLPTE